MHTVVSILPAALAEVKPGLVPSLYVIEASKNNEPEVLHVDRARFAVYIGDGRSLAQYTESDVVANSIVNDFSSAQLAVTDTARPGLFVVEGKVEKQDVAKRFPGELKKAKTQQLEWFARLIRMADDEWKKYQSHRSITDYMRMAAEHLNMKRDWLLTIDDYRNCPACQSKISSLAIICPQCKTIMDEAKYKSTFKQAV